MNILIQQTKAFPHRANSFYWFYAQLTEWLTAHGVDSKLYFSYLELLTANLRTASCCPIIILNSILPATSKQSVASLSTNR